MFASLREKIGSGAMDTAINAITPILSEQMEKITGLKPSDINDDDKFDSVVISPLLLSIKAASSGVTGLIPNFNERFKGAMYHLRKELIVIEGDKVSLVENAQENLPGILLESLKQSA